MPRIPILGITRARTRYYQKIFSFFLLTFLKIVIYYNHKRKRTQRTKKELKMKIIFNKMKDEWGIVTYINLKKTHQMKSYYKYAHQLNFFCFIILW